MAEKSHPGAANVSVPSATLEPQGASKRQVWDRKVEFALSLLGYAVGLGNVVRFPYLVQRNGGGSFLVPYFLCLLVCGIPLYYLEIVMGQSTRKSCLACWDSYVPVLKGAGYGMVIISFLCTSYYQVYITWILYYIGASVVGIVKWQVPWMSCSNTWNTRYCVSTEVGDNSSSENVLEELNSTKNYIYNVNENFNISINGTAMSAAEEYWQHNVLRLSGDIANVGYPSWELLVSHCVGWIVLYFCLRKGVRSVGKVVWVTATSPYILIIIFLVKAALLPGSMQGVKFYLTPNFESLKNPEVWILAFVQVFYSVGTGWGGVITMASYNKPNHKFYHEALWIPVTTCLTSFVNGFVVFSCAGFLAHRSGRPVQEAVSSGPGLAFITYPEVTSHLPAGPVWAFLFFLMMFMVGIDSLFVAIETCASCVKDELPEKFKSIPLWVIVLFNFSFGILYLTNGGIYFFQLIDWYLTVISIFTIAIIECVGLIWVYGYDKLSRDIRNMVKKCPPKWIAVPVTGVIMPVLLAAAMFWTLGKLSKPTYGSYVFPQWSEGLGWFIAILVVVPIPSYVVVQLMKLRNEERGEIVRRMLRPYGVVPRDDPVEMI